MIPKGYRAYLIGRSIAIDNPATLSRPVGAWEAVRVDVSKAFGRAVKARRAECDLTQEALAEKGDLGRAFLSAMERGEKAPTIKTVWKLAMALDCKPSDLWLTTERLMEAPPKKRR